jgi:hypothetical protein
LPGARVIPNAGPKGTLIAVKQSWQATGRREMRIWFPDAARKTGGTGKKVPLVIFLHGEIGNNAVGDGQMLATPAEFSLWIWAMNVANVVSPFIEAGKVKPMVIAAPSETIANRGPNTGRLFLDLKLHEVVSLVTAAVTDPGVSIDNDQVAVVGWSGAGGYPHAGLMKIGGDEGGEFPALGAMHRLIMIGIADARSDNAILSTAIQAGLKKIGNDKTVVYCLQKDNGGWKDPGTVPTSKIVPFADGFDAKTDFGLPLPNASGGTAVDGERADQETFDFYRVDDKTNPKRIVTRVRGGKFAPSTQKPGLYKKTELFHTEQAHLHADAAASPGKPGDDLPDAGKPPPHRMPPLLWTLYALQRFFRV